MYMHKQHLPPKPHRKLHTTGCTDNCGAPNRPIFNYQYVQTYTCDHILLQLPPNSKLSQTINYYNTRI